MDMNPVRLAPAQKAFSLLEEFKKFAFKGNLIDMAIGIVLGAAFGKLVESLVKNLIMPMISIVLPGEGGYTSWALEINGVTIPFGLFLGELVNFLVLAFAVFVFMVKIVGLLVRKKEEAAAAPPPPTKTEELLTEIRDTLKQRSD